MVDYVGYAGLVLLVALYNSVLWALAWPIAALLVAVIADSGTASEPTLRFMYTVTAIGLASTVFSVLFALPVARMVLRTWPVRSSTRRRSSAGSSRVSRGCCSSSYSGRSPPHSPPSSTSA